MTEVALADGFLDVPDEYVPLADIRIATTSEPGQRPLTIAEFRKLAVKKSIPQPGSITKHAMHNQKDHGNRGTVSGDIELNNQIAEKIGFGIFEQGMDHPQLSYLASEGRMVPFKEKVVARGSKAQCHKDACKIAGLGGTLYTGFAVEGKDGIWVPHSWVMDGDQLIEPWFSDFTHYWGAPDKKTSVEAMSPTSVMADILRRRYDIAKHASPTHGTGTSQKVHGNWAHPGYTDLLDPKTGDMTVTPRPGGPSFTQTALFHPDLFDKPTNIPEPGRVTEDETDLARPFTGRKEHPAAFERMDGKKFKFMIVDGPTLSDGITPLRKGRLNGYIDNFPRVTPALAVVEMHAMREYLLDVEQYGIDMLKKRKLLGRIDEMSQEDKIQYNILSNHANAARDEMTATYAAMDVMAGRALPEIKRIGTEVQGKIEKAWKKANEAAGIPATMNLTRDNVKYSTPDDLAQAFPNDRRIQELHGEYTEQTRSFPTLVPEPKSLPIPEWVKIPRTFARRGGYPESPNSTLQFNRWAHEEFRDWHNSQDSLPGDTGWQQTDGNPEQVRWVSAVEYKDMLNEAWRLGRQEARKAHHNEVLRKASLVRERARELLPNRREVVLDVLKTYRPFGGEVKTINQRTGKGQKHLQSEANYIPTDWIETSNHYGNLLVYSDKSKRGHYNHDNEDWVSRVQAEVGRSDRAHVTLHEFGHRVEHTNPVVTALERHFYDQRTKGEPFQRLRDLQPGYGYKYHEKARPDEFINPYKGKAYGRRGEFRTQRLTGQYWTTEAYELLSMGIYEAYTTKFSADKDFMSFIYGLMVTA